MKKIKLLFVCVVATIAGMFTACGDDPNNEKTAVETVSLNTNTLSLAQGETATLTATVEPEDAANKEVKWESDDPSVATVDPSGKVTAVARGTATITVTTVSGGKTDRCSVTVKENIAVEKVSLDVVELPLEVGETATLTATVEPEEATNKEVKWESDDPSVATVDQTGKVTAVAVGTATITVTTLSGGKTDRCAVTVNPLVVDVTGVDVEPTVSIHPGGTVTLTAVVSPAEATNTKVGWSTSDETIATVDENGLVTGVAMGSAKITVTTEDGSFTDDCTVTVNFLGKVTFLSDKTWTVGTQTWSDAVMAAGCKKDSYAGGNITTPLADCRQNIGYGDLYSYVAVTQYASELCPDGWRVPTGEDFATLDAALGGNGAEQTNAVLLDMYLNTWGGVGYESFYNQGTAKYENKAQYWSSSPSAGSAYTAMNLVFDTSGLVSPQKNSMKALAMALRCVK